MIYIPVVFPALGWIVPILFYKDGLGIELLVKVNMPLNQKIKTNQRY